MIILNKTLFLHVVADIFIKYCNLTNFIRSGYFDVIK